MIILGIDPGLAIVGWGVLQSDRGHFALLAAGAIRTPAGHPIPERLAMIYEDMQALIERYRPDEMAIEELFFDKNITTGIPVAEARGVILLAAQQHRMPIGEYTPMQVKQAVVGYGKAEKRQVIAMVTSHLRLPAPPKPDDTADAIAVALCHGQTGVSRMARFYNQ